VQQQNKNAQKIAEALTQHDAIKAVYYPGLETHPHHQLAARQMHGFGGMLSFELQDNNHSISEFCSRLGLIKTAVSLGGVETTVTIPSLTSHAKMSPEDRKQIGISDSLLRLSVGIEDAQDLIDDLIKAL